MEMELEIDKKRMLQELTDEIQEKEDKSKVHVKTEVPLMMDATMSSIKYLLNDIINDNIFIKEISVRIPQAYFPQVFEILKQHQDLLTNNTVSWEIKRQKGKGFDLIITH